MQSRCTALQNIVPRTSIYSVWRRVKHTIYLLFSSLHYFSKCSYVVCTTYEHFEIIQDPKTVLL